MGDIARGLWGLCGWYWPVILLAFAGGIWIGSNSPQTFRRSRQALERIANEAAAKAKELAMKGKG